MWRLPDHCIQCWCGIVQVAGIQHGIPCNRSPRGASTSRSSPESANMGLAMSRSVMLWRSAIPSYSGLHPGVGSC
jgi:hypothetical protein